MHSMIGGSSVINPRTIATDKTRTSSKILKHPLHERDVRLAPAECLNISILLLGDVERLDDAVVDEHRKATAAGVAEGRELQGQAEGLGQLAAGVGQHGDDAVGTDTLIPGPGIHDGTVIHRIEQNVGDTLGPQLLLPLKISLHLHREAVKGEGARQANDDHLPAIAEGSQREGLRRKAPVQGHIRNPVAHLDSPRLGNVLSTCRALSFA
mmetsp:Transcript_94539/g.271146  ORF Transcript_94539/g.271146 Transcript_94539/m.271146 type:complete len:210 (+) Transcript_94539:353-982(+)